MVVIEPVDQTIAEQNKTEKIPKSKPPIREDTPPPPSSSSASDIANTPGYASDGFETASEADLCDDDNVVEQGKTEEEERERSQLDGNKVVADQRGEQEQRVELTEEQIHEKALAEANNAKLEGNTLFKDGHYEEALSKYEIALQAVSNISSSVDLCSVCHANCAACYSKLGKFEDTIKECTKALELNPTYIKVLLRRAEAHEKLEHFDEAIVDTTKVLEVDPSNDQARRNLLRLKPLADEKREKMKEEMIGKLKEMGNSVLGRFGMSVDNFKAVKDPNTGSYSISFQR